MESKELESNTNQYTPLLQCKNDAELIIRVAKEELLKRCENTSLVQSNDRSGSQQTEEKNQSSLLETSRSVSSSTAGDTKKN